MKILEGLLTINGVDIYKEYNAFLAEDSAAGHSNYDELLKVPAMKAYTTVSFREENGERLPDVLPEPHYEARDVTLQFGILTGTKEEWYRNPEKSSGVSSAAFFYFSGTGLCRRYQSLYNKSGRHMADKYSSHSVQR